MIYDVSKFEQLVDEGYLRKSVKDDLVLYGYTDKCTFDRHWNEHTRIARGLILNKHTGEVVAKPFPKFFNIGEMEETFLNNLPKTNYTVSEKVDGSLGIIYYYNDQWNIATRGSFYSEQAIKGQELLKKYDINRIGRNYTILVEIIYPENKIIVNYGQEEKLVVLGGFNKNTMEELDNYSILVISSTIGSHFASHFDYSIEEMIALQKTLPKDQEGFVVRFDNGLRIKIKGEEYCRIQKIISHMSPISFWESMEHGVVNKTYLEQIPEEFKLEFEPIVEELELQYSNVMREILADIENLPTKELTKEGRKTIGLFLNDATNIKHKGAMFSYLMDQKENVNKYILKVIRPTGNVLKDSQ